MAEIRRYRKPTTNVRSIMLDTLSGTGSSGWTEVGGRQWGSILFDISAAATIQVRGSNTFDPDDDSYVPSDADDGTLLDTVTAADPEFTWSMPVQWIKLLVTVNTGTVSAYLQGV